MKEKEYFNKFETYDEISTNYKERIENNAMCYLLRGKLDVAKINENLYG